MAHLYPYWDNSLGKMITGPMQRAKLMKQRGVHDANDDPKLREIKKMGDFYTKNGTIPDNKARKEMTETFQKKAKEDLHTRVDKSIKQPERERIVI